MLCFLNFQTGIQCSKYRFLKNQGRSNLGESSRLSKHQEGGVGLSLSSSMSLLQSNLISSACIGVRNLNTHYLCNMQFSLKLCLFSHIPNISGSSRCSVAERYADCIYFVRWKERTGWILFPKNKFMVLCGQDWVYY